MGSHVRVIASTIRYGSNGFKHAGDEFNLPDDEAKAKAEAGLVEIIGPAKSKSKAKEEKAETATKELKEEVKTK